MEPIRPSIDCYVLNWISTSPLKRSWFFEERDGCCRLMSELTVTLSNTAPSWSREVAPIVEWFAQALPSTASESGRVRAPGTRLTQRRRYEGAGASVPIQKDAPQQQNVCTLCGSAVTPGNQFCYSCGLEGSRQRLSTARELGREAARSPEALQKRSKKMNRHRDAMRNWKPSELPDWLTSDVYITKIYPALERLSKSAIASALGVSRDYAYQIANGNRVPHKRHWVKLAGLTGVGARSAG